MTEKTKRIFDDEVTGKQYTQIVLKYTLKSKNTIYLLSFDKNIWLKPVRISSEGVIEDAEARYVAKSYGWLFFQFTVSKFLKLETNLV